MAGAIGALGLTLACATVPRSQTDDGPAVATAAILTTSVTADADGVQRALEDSLARQGFGILLRANMGATLATYADTLGEDYNRSGLEEIRSLSFCNPKFANEAANVDPNALALCPLRVTILQKDGKSTILFAPPSHSLPGTAAIDTIQTVEAMVQTAIAEAVEAARSPSPKPS